MTQKDLIKLTRQFGLFLHPKAAKSTILSLIKDITNDPLNNKGFKKEWVLLAKEYNSIILSNKREKILNILLK